MKRNLLFKQVTAIGKRLAMVLTMLLIVGIGQAWGATYTLDQASLTTSKSAYQTSDYTHTATDGSKWVLNGYGIITTSPKHIQLGKASKNYIKTPTCTGNITEVSITFAKACSHYIAIWDMDGNIASSTIASKPAANSTKTFTISGEHKQLQIIGTRTSDGTSITSSNAAAYISSITITYETAASYTVTYNANGGSGTMSNSTGSSIKIKECTFTAPECKQFTSWNTAANGSGTSYAPNATVATNLTLYAQWEDLPVYTVKLMDNNEVLTSSCNTPITLPSREGCDGYTFVGWTSTWTSAQSKWTTTKPTIINAGAYTPTANVNLYPVYTKTVTTSGTTTTTTEYVLTDLANIKSTDVVVITSKNSSNDYYAMSNNNGTSSAPAATKITVSSSKLSSAPDDKFKWNISNNSGTLTIYPNGTTSTWLYCTSTNNGVRVGTNTAKAFTIDATSGYLKHTGTSRYIGVYNNADWRCYTSVNDNIKNQTLAFFVETTTTTTTSTTTTSYISTPECTKETSVTLQPNGGTISDGNWTLKNGAYELTTENESITLPEITRTGYTFAGWATSAGGGEVYNDKATINNLDGTAVNLYAIWTPITYTITYELNGGTNYASNPANYTIETETITLQNPNKANHNFVGWYKESTFATQVTQITKGSTGNITLYAKWEEIPTTCTVTYNANGGTGTVPTDNTQYTSGAIVTVLGNYGKLTKDGHAFIGWSDGKNTYKAGDQFAITSNTTLYAQWCEAYWKLVTDASELENDTRIVIAAKDYDVALSTTQNTNNRGQAPITKEYNTAILVDTVQTLTLGDATNNNYWLRDSDEPTTGYLYAASSSANNLKTGSLSNGNGDWSIAITQGVAIILAQGDKTHNQIKYNHQQSGQLFSCYESTNTTMSDVVIYKEVCKQDAYNVTSNLTNATAANNNPTSVSATVITSLTLNYTANDGYLLPETIIVKMGGVALSSTDDYTWNKENGQLTIKVTGFYGDIDVTIVAETDPCYGFAMSAVTATSTSNSITLSWTAVEGATGYKVKLGTGDFTAATGTSHTFEGLSPKTTYNWEVQVVKGTCEASKTGSTTTQKETFTINWVANGQSHHTQTALEGTDLEMPSAPDMNDYDACDDKVFVGWTETQIVNSTNTKPSDLFTTKSGTLTANKTYHAVFATAEGTPSTDYEKITNVNDLTDGNYVIAYSYDGGTQVVLKNTTKNTTQMNGTNLSLSSGIYANPDAAYIWQLTAQSDGSYYIYNSAANKYLSATTSALQLSDTPTKYNISYDSSNSRWTVVLKDNSTYYMHGYVSGSSYDFRVSTSGSGNKYRVYLYKNTSTLNYSEYVTTCVAVPDPVLSFVTTPADPIVFDPVNCGGTTAKAQAKTVQVSGANLQEYVSVEVTGPYKIARTSSTNLSDYTTSLTLDITAAGAINAIYIISCPPAQSTDATTGTLTFTTKKGNTLTVNLSTPTVNCTTYALTFNDRGNKTVENYYAGASVPQPADPTGVCTEPIHYVFDGWAERTVANGSEYTKVTFPYTMPGQNKTLYAVYRYLTSGGNGDYNLVTSVLDDWSGDYLIAYDNETFADGTVGGEDGIGKLNNKVDLSSYISNNSIPATEGDKYHVTLEAVTGGYVLKTQDGKYNYHTNNDKNGISATTAIGTADNYPINVNFVSQEEINLCLTGDAAGSVLRYNTSGYFRFYKNSGQQPVYLYKKSTGTTLYTTSPVCGPLVEITSDKDIYVTGGKGVHSTVVAQKKITFSATRLQPNAGGNAPSIKVPAADITITGTPTTKVALSITQNMEEQGDGTYAGTGEITITYTPTEYNVNEDINVQLRAEYNTGSDVTLDAFTIHARSLPQEFVIVAKQGDKWYALNGDMSNGSSANPANGHVVVDDDNEPTKATYAPCNTIYTFDGLPNTGDRKFVRFQGTDGAWLWAASGTNVGIQNKSLKNTPSGNMEESKPYNWEIETENNITYFFHNANSSRVLRLNDGKFGMYVGGTDVIRILPYEAKCLYNYAPSNLKVSELKSTYVTLVWDAVVGATKYQYSTDATNWTDAGSEPTVTINGLTSETNYTYYIRAYHADAGVSQECFDYSQVTFTTANCDDVPTDITYTADLNSITVSWTASAPTATIKLSMNADGTGGGGIYKGATSPYKISGGLTKNTTYYIQILADGTCASPIIPVKTEDVKVDIVEWLTDGIIVDINTNETVGVTLENEVSYGSGSGEEATELFFSKYYEATGNVKLVAIYNGTKNIIDLTDYEIHYGKDSWENQYVALKDFGETKGQIQPGEELILYTTNESSDDDKILNCVNEQYPDGKWVRVTQTNNDGGGHLSFAGNKTLVLKKAGQSIDVIGALDSSGKPTSENANAKPSWGDDIGWNCATGLSIADDSQIGISTNRCLLIRNNTVTSGENAVANNINDFVTLCSEWKGAQVPDNNVDNGVAASCENFAYVGTFDYSDYYTQFEPMGEKKTFDEQARNEDGTVTIEIPDLYKQSCRNIRITLSDKDGNVISDREYKVPIMITTTQGTDGNAFTALQQNLATIEKDGEDNVVATHPLSLDEVREICKTCDVIIRDNATLMKMADDAANDHPQVRDIYVYENSSLIVPAGTNYTINSLSLRRKGDKVASLNVYPDALKLPESSAAPITLDLRIDAQNWHWFALPYNCNISEVTWADGTPTQFNTDWFLMTYDGESRSKEQSAYENHWKQYFGTTIEEGKGYIVGITGDINNPARTYELRFPIAKEVLADEKKEKTVDVRAWGVEDDIRPNKKGWNLIGNPYLTHYQKNNVNSFGGLRLGELIGPDPQTGYWTKTGNLPYVVVPVDGGWTSYDQLLVSETDLLPFTAYFVQVGNDGVHTSEQDLKIAFDSTKLLLSTIPMPASLIRRAPSEIDEVKEPVIVCVSLTNSLGESDKTSLIIDNQYTDEYEMNADFFKWFGDYYKYYTKPVLYTIGADDGKRAFNAISEELASQPISLGMYAAKAGDYTFTLDRRSDLSKVQEVWLYDATQDTYTNLLQDSYTFQTAKTESAGRFFLSVKMAPKVSTEMDNVADGTVWATTQDHTIVVNGLLSDAQLWIYDATGKLLHTDHTLYYQHSYSVPQSGTYFVRVQNTMQTQTIKVVVE